MEKMFNLSANGIKLYEKSGILKPRRCEQGHYRQYDQNEMQAMGCALQYRGYGFSIQDTAQLLNEMNDAQKMQTLSDQADRLESQIDHLIMVRKSLKEHTRRAEHAFELLDSCVVEEKPAMYFLCSQRGSDFSNNAAPEMTGDWIARYAPHLSAASLLDGPYFTDATYNKPPQLGVAVDAHVAISLGLSTSKYVTYLPPMRCVVTAICSPSRTPDIEPTRARVMAYAKANGLTLHAGGFSRLVLCERSGRDMMTLGLLWAPIEHDKSNLGDMV